MDAETGRLAGRFKKKMVCVREGERKRESEREGRSEKSSPQKEKEEDVGRKKGDGGRIEES